jgi:hypothetical protein
VDRIVLELALELCFQEVLNIPRVGRVINVPKGTSGLPVGGWLSVEHDIYRIRHAHVQTSRPLSPRRI